MVEKTKIDFLTKKIILNLKEKEAISIEDILEICRREEYLPNNRADAYHYLNKLISIGLLTKVKNGLYEVNKIEVGVVLSAE